MQKLRSILFLFLFYFLTLVQMIFWTPVYFFLPRHHAWKIPKLWGKINLWLQYKIVGTRFDFRGMEHIPDEGGFIVAAKHQSSWETYTLLPFLKDPTYVLKRELMFIPFFGWYAMKMNIVPVHRGKKGKALHSMTKNARPQLEGGRSLVIYPEGTRKLPEAKPDYKYGVSHLYSEINVPVLPVALNSGMHWARNSFHLKRGTTVLEFLEPIKPGMEKAKFAERLETVIEEKTAELIQEAQAENEYQSL